MTRRLPWRPRLTRDLVLFVVALGLLIYEVIFRSTADPEVLTVCIALLLAPGVLRYDEKRRERDEDEP